MDLLDELHQRILIADGAMGTELLAAGAAAGESLEALCLTRPELVEQVHRSYLAAGAQLIRTNSFGANAARLARHGLDHRVNEINWTAAQLARDCVKGTDVRVAASVGPIGLTEDQAEARCIDRKEVFEEQIGALLDGGARVVVFETFTDLEELKLALEVKQSLHHCPAIASVSCDDTGHLADGTLLADAFAELHAAEADILCVNCIAVSPALLTTLGPLPKDAILAMFPSAGLPKEKAGGRLEYPIKPRKFVQDCRVLAEHGATLIGGCCGAGPAHIAALAAAFAAKGA